MWMFGQLANCLQINDYILISTNISTFIATTTMTMLARTPQVRHEFFQKIIRYTNYQVAANCKIITTYIHYKRVVSTSIPSY